MVRPDHLHHERLAGRVLERVIEPEQKREGADLPDADLARDGQQSEDQGLDAHRALKPDHHPALVHAIGDHAAIGRQQQYGDGL